MRNFWREVTRKMAARFQTWAFAWAKPKHSSSVPKARPLLSYNVKPLQTLHLNYSDQMTQFVFDVAWHGDGVSDLLAQ
jgi:hypothetical protein